MTLTRPSNTSARQVGDRVQAHRSSAAASRRICSIYSAKNDGEYAEHADDMGRETRIWATSDRSSLPISASVRGETR